MTRKPRIAHLAGPTATIQNTPPLVTSNKARQRYDLAPRMNAQGTPLRYDALRAQRLAAPAKIYVEQFSAHPLERDAAALYGPPDGYIGADGLFSTTRKAAGDKPVYEIEIKPEDGLYPMPYMARQADGRAWEEEGADAGGPAEKSRQGFFPDGSRSFEEVDRLGIGMDGLAGTISALADVDFYRVLPPAGYTSGLPEGQRTDTGKGDIGKEKAAHDFFAYKPGHLATQPPRPALAKLTNDVQAVMDDNAYDGAIWTQGSPNIEESAYWMSLLIDTRKPIACNAAQRPHGQIGNDGPPNLLDSVRYITSKAWDDGTGRNRLGTIMVEEQQFFAAREVYKSDARPGNYRATGGHGGILGQVTHLGNIHITYLPAYKHTHTSDVRLTQLPASVEAVRADRHGKLERVTLPIKDAKGRLLETAIPDVSIVKDGGYCTLEWGDDPALEGDLIASITGKLGRGRLAGYVVEGTVPYGKSTSPARLALVTQAIFSGLPVVRVGRGTPEGFADPDPFFIAGANLTAIKARLLLMAAMMKLGSLPIAKDPTQPTADEKAATQRAVQTYQRIFDTH